MLKVRLNLSRMAVIATCFAVATIFTGCEKEKTFIVTFDSKGGSDVQTQTIEKGGKAKEPTEPTLENFNFAGWTTSDDETSPLWDFEAGTVEKDMTLYALWLISGSSFNGVQIVAKVQNAQGNSVIAKVKLIFEEYNGNSEVINSEVIASADFNDGTFILDLPETVNSKWLFAVGNETLAGLSISNRNAKISQQAIIYGYNAADKRVACFNYTMINFIWGISEGMELWYTDSDVNISGQVKYAEDNWEATDVYSLELKKGWNYVYTFEKETRQGGKTIYELKMSTTPDGSNVTNIITKSSIFLIFSFFCFSSEVSLFFILRKNMFHDFRLHFFDSFRKTIC